MTATKDSPRAIPPTPEGPKPASPWANFWLVLLRALGAWGT
jgi:hypothetical protein